MEKSKEKLYNEHLRTHPILRTIYSKLVPFKGQFTDLKEFLLNSERATRNVKLALFLSNHKNLTNQDILNNVAYYETSNELKVHDPLSPVYGNPYRLNSFELFLTKFICGWLIGNFPESQKHKDFYYSTIDDTIENNNHDVQIFVNYEFMDEPHRIEKNNTDNNWELKMVTIQPSPSPLSPYLNDQVSVEWEDLLKSGIKSTIGRDRK